MKKEGRKRARNFFPPFFFFSFAAAAAAFFAFPLALHNPFLLSPCTPRPPPNTHYSTLKNNKTFLPSRGCVRERERERRQRLERELRTKKTHRRAPSFFCLFFLLVISPVPFFSPFSCVLLLFQHALIQKKTIEKGEERESRRISSVF